jgi:hypothetical protein
MRYAVGEGDTLRALIAIGGHAALKEDRLLAVDTSKAYTRRVKKTGERFTMPWLF